MDRGTLLRITVVVYSNFSFLFSLWRRSLL
jgi:hypothetical protein